MFLTLLLRIMSAVMSLVVPNYGLAEWRICFIFCGILRLLMFFCSPVRQDNTGEFSWLRVPEQNLIRPENTRTIIKFWMHRIGFMSWWKWWFLREKKVFAIKYILQFIRYAVRCVRSAAMMPLLRIYKIKSVSLQASSPNLLIPCRHPSREQYGSIYS